MYDIMAEHVCYRGYHPTNSSTGASACLSTQEVKQDILVVILQDTRNLKSWNTEKGHKTT